MSQEHAGLTEQASVQTLLTTHRKNKLCEGKDNNEDARILKLRLLSKSVRGSLYKLGHSGFDLCEPVYCTTSLSEV